LNAGETLLSQKVLFETAKEFAPAASVNPYFSEARVALFEPTTCGLDWEADPTLSSLTLRYTH
jgi:hypothetical protein